MEHLKDGLKVHRGAWGSTVWLELRKPMPQDDLTLPVIVMRMSTGSKVAWAPTHIDLLAKDWRPAGV